MISYVKPFLKSIELGKEGDKKGLMFTSWTAPNPRRTFNQAPAFEI